MVKKSNKNFPQKIFTQNNIKKITEKLFRYQKGISKKIVSHKKNCCQKRILQQFFPEMSKLTKIIS